MEENRRSKAQLVAQLTEMRQRIAELEALETERRRAEDALRQRNRELELLNLTARAFNSTLDLDEVLLTVLEELRRLLGVVACSAWLVDPDTRELVCRQLTDPQSEIVRGWRLKPGQGLVGWVVEHGESLNVPDARLDERHYKGVDARTGLPLRSILSIPLRVKGKVIGVLQAVDAEVNRFSATDLTLLEPLAGSAAIAIENARLVQGLEKEVEARTAEIRAEQQKSETILRSVGDAIVMTDLRMQVQYVNDAFTTLTGYRAGEALGQHINTLVGGWIPEQTQQSLQLTMAQGEVWQGEVTLRRKDGRTYDAALTVAPVRNARGELVGCVSSHRDTSQQKELDRARSRFMTHVSHELRTPVTSIKLYAGMLRSRLPVEQAKRYLAVLEEQADRLEHLVEDILEMTSLDSGRAVEEWEPLGLSVLIGGTMARFQGQAEEARLRLVARPLPPELPPLHGDAVRLAQALGEVVENALNFTPPAGEVTVEVASSEDEGQRWVAIAVRDSGPGISVEEQERIFDRFYRGSLTESGHIPGTGLGLSLAQGILRAHGGRLTVESALGEGSTFTLWLRSAPDRGRGSPRV